MRSPTVPVPRLEVEQNALALQYASARLRADRGFVLEAVKHGMPLSCVSAYLRLDREVVLAAVQQRHSALALASDELRRDPAFVRRACEIHPGARSCALVEPRALVLQYSGCILEEKRRVERLCKQLGGATIASKTTPPEQARCFASTL